MTKSQIRNHQKELRDRLSAEEHMILSSAILNKLLDTEEYQKCSKILTYLSFRSETDTSDIIRYSVKLGKEVYIPKVEEQGLEFYRINHLDGLIKSKFGVLEPAGEDSKRYCRDEDPKYRDLMLLPGLAFDHNGNRIGYGAGYYDKYLASHLPDSFSKIALAYDFQVIDHIPADDFDIRVDKIITPTRVISAVS